MKITKIIESGVIAAVKELYGADVDAKQVNINETRSEFEGDYTVVVFPFTRAARKKPEEIGQQLGEKLVSDIDVITDFNVVKGFLNLSLSPTYWLDFLVENYKDEKIGFQPSNGQKVMVEFCSPNTNKPLHLGHIRNILLGWSTSKILEASGYEVVKVQIINDRGIAICKSMLAWQKFGNGETPESSGIKGDHLAGKYYVLFDKEFKKEYSAWQTTDVAKEVFAAQGEEGQTEEQFFKTFKDKYFNEYSELGKEAKAMLLKWESNDEDTIALWKQMNNWVYEGFDVTYKKLQVTFDKLYYESNTYLLGKDMVEKGVADGVFYQKEDGSTWAKLDHVKGLDDKVIVRSNGTSLYITQDMGTAHLRYQDYGVEKMIYVVADEQNDHFRALFEILKDIKEPYADGLYHLSYGMVDLPTGKMKSREGTVVDADDLVAEVIKEALANAEERETLADLEKEDQLALVKKVALGALKYFMLKVHPKRRMTFNPKESVDLQGQTGPYVQNAYVRVKSVLRKAAQENMVLDNAKNYANMSDVETRLVLQISQFEDVIAAAADEYSPSLIANYCYNLAKDFHRFYHDHPILSAKEEAAKDFRLMLSIAISNVLKNGMELLGIEMPERM